MTKLKEKQVSFSSKDMTPVGTVILHLGSSVPEGYILADGSPVSRTYYNALWTVFGTKYGEGDGSTTFNLPNLVGVELQGIATLPCIKY